MSGRDIKSITKETTTLHWNTTEQVFAKKSKGKVFNQAYKEEASRIHIAQALREARIAQKITQASLAKKVDMPQSAIARLESGNHSVSFTTLTRVAHVLGKEVRIV